MDPAGEVYCCSGFGGYVVPVVTPKEVTPQTRWRYGGAVSFPHVLIGCTSCGLPRNGSEYAVPVTAPNEATPQTGWCYLLELDDVGRRGRLIPVDVFNPLHVARAPEFETDRGMGESPVTD